MSVQTELAIEIEVEDAEILSSDPLVAPGTATASFILNVQITNNSEQIIGISGSTLTLQLFDPDGSAVEYFLNDRGKWGPDCTPLAPGESRTIDPMKCTVNGIPVRAEETYAVRVSYGVCFEECEFQFKKDGSVHPK